MTARWRWLWPYVRGQLPALGAVLVLAALASALSIALPYLSKLIIDRGLIGRNFPLLLQLCGLVVGLAALSLLLGAVVRWVYVNASARILFGLREDVYGHLLDLPPEFYRRRVPGDLVTRLDGDVAEIQRFSTDTLLAFINGLLMLAGSVSVMMIMSWQLSLAAAAVLPLQLLVRRWARPRIARRTRAIREQSGVIAQFLFETLSAVKAIQGVVMEQYHRQRLRGLNRDYLSRLLALQMVSYGVGGVSGLLSHTATAVVFVYGGYRVIEGLLTVGTLVAFVAYMARGTGSALSLLNLYTAYQRAIVSVERVEELLAVERSEAPLASGSGRQQVTNNALVLERVGLGMSACGAVLLSDCSLEIPAGAKVVIHGASGVGKSTLIDALRRFATLDAGRILLGGIDIREYDLATLRHSIGMLVSDPVIFAGTVLENLRFGNPDAAAAELFEAARRAGLPTGRSALHAGPHSLISGTGQGLSTGQRQRIGVARALLHRPQVLVLDEALTNLDADAARELHDLLDQQFAGCTRIVVTHVPSRVPRADLIVEMRDGRLWQAPRALRA